MIQDNYAVWQSIYPHMLSHTLADILGSLWGRSLSYFSALIITVLYLW